MRYLIRILTLPFFMGISGIGVIMLWMKYNLNFIRFGGEVITYTNKNERKTIRDVYLKLTNHESERSNTVVVEQ